MTSKITNDRLPAELPGSLPVAPTAPYEESIETIAFDFALTRRQFGQILGTGLLGAGLLITVLDGRVLAQATRRGGGGRGGAGGGGAGATVSTRLHIGQDGTITVLVGKVEGGQGARAELTAAAAEELRVPVDRVTLIMADTAQVPDDGITAGSGTTPRTLPSVRQAAAAARELLIAAAVTRWNLTADKVEMHDGKVIDAADKRELSYAELAKSDDKAFAQSAPANVVVTATKDWKVLGTPVARPNGRDLVTGGHKYPSDITQPGMLHGKVLRSPTYRGKLASIDLGPAKAMKDVVVVQDGSFVGVAAPTTFQAQQALDAIAATAKWDRGEQPASAELFDYLAKHASQTPANPFADDLAKAAKSLKASYHVGYAQHAPLEPRAACAVWENGKLTAWTGTQNPFGVRSELVRAFHLTDDVVRVIVPDFGAGFGGKHTGEAAVEAARLAQAAGKPVSLRWTREEEFTWAYFRPAAVVNVEAGIDAAGNITCWHFVDINAGAPGIETPYSISGKRARSQAVGSDAPLRQGSYRALAATGNNFARESAMDELAVLAGRDPLEFRLAHLEAGRLKNVLQEAAAGFDWATQSQKKEPNVGVGLACGTEKNSVVAACAEVAVEKDAIVVRRVCQAFECGAIANPGNLLAQVKGALIMGLGPALREATEFKDGVMTNATFAGYLVPRFADVPQLDIRLVNRPDLPSTGAGETPIIAIAPAIANAVFRATGQRIRSMPIRLTSV